MYAAIDAIVQDDPTSIAAACNCLEVSRSSFYAWRHFEPNQFQRRDNDLVPLVRAIFWKHRRRYGARRIAKELADMKLVVSERKVAKLMKTQRLRAIQPKSFQPKTTDSRHRLGYSPNLLLEGFELGGTNQLWVGDITYIPLQARQFAYLAMLMDRFSRAIVGWHLAEHMTEEIVFASFQMAVRGRQPKAALIHHSDRGGQYAGRRFRAALKRAGAKQSMSRADNCYDNAFMESCFGTLKTELEMTEYEHVDAALREIAEYIDYYNTDRKHSAIGYLTPSQFETALSR